MEINVHNALPTVVKLTFRPYLRLYQTAEFETLVKKLAVWLLDNPLITTTVISLLFAIFFVFILISFLIITAVFCFIVIVLLIKGYIILMCVVSICVIVIFITFILFGISAFRNKSNECVSI